MLTGLELRRAILQALADHQATDPLTPYRQEELAKKLGVDADRLEAHFVVLERGGQIQFMNIPDGKGHRQRFVSITTNGEKHLKDGRNFETPKGVASPFKVVAGGGEEKVITDFGELRSFVERTEWVLDDEKPEILEKVAELEKTLGSDRFDPGTISGLKLYFERHKWLSPHVAALVKKQYGF